MVNNTPESMTRAVVEACADCDVCRTLMEDTPCQLFPELYRLYDKEVEKTGSITTVELRNMIELCNFCALCPCPNVRSNIMKAKNAFIDRDGLKPAIRLLEDVEHVARLCGAYPRLTNALLGNRRAGGSLRRAAGIHAERKFPVFPKESFPVWARKQRLRIRKSGTGRKVAYFAGCTGQYLFPDVPKAVVEVLQRNGAEVYYPEQKCCGMPSLLEGDSRLTLELAASNVEHLTEAVEAGYDVVCSCPTCGYMLKNVLSEGARHAVPTEANSSGKQVFEGLFRDEGYFACIDAGKRLQVASHTYDLGEYLRKLQLSGELNTNLGSVATHMAYYPPCHLREQKIGEPWADLLSLVPGTSIEKIDGSFYCCGIAGIMGFKRDFHETSVKMGSPLMEKIEAIHPERLLTDCLSCRLQFNQLTSYKVFHPVEILREAYSNHK
jgi:glycerol-3-phosphate dehydrogenase subunit C